MKRTSSMLLLMSLAAASITASAAQGFPASADETTSLASEFPGVATYADQHRADALNQQWMTYPSAGVQEMPLSSEFPSLRSYADVHRDDGTAVANAPAWPSSADETTSMAEEGLVPALNGAGANAYAGAHHGAPGE